MSEALKKIAALMDQATAEDLAELEKKSSERALDMMRVLREQLGREPTVEEHIAWLYKLMATAYVIIDEEL